FGFAIAYVFHPVLKWLDGVALPFISKNKLSRRACRAIATCLTLLFVILLLVTFFSFIIPELIENISNIGSQISLYAANLERYLTDIFSKFSASDNFSPIVTKVMSSMEQIFSRALATMSQTLTGIINTTISTTISITHTLINFFVGIIIAIYLWLSKETFLAQVKKLASAFLPKNLVDYTTVLIHDCNKIFSGFISGKILDSLIIGVLCYIGLLLLNIPYALLISVIVGVTNVIPYFGPFIGAIPSAILLLMVDPMKALWFCIFILVLQQIDGNVIGPKILGDSTGLPAFWVIFSVTVFGGLFGFTGMLIGVPLFAVIYMLIRRLCITKLQKKGLATDTKNFASPNNPLITNEKKKK
ncbi:MAG: AI-2E family transporter, partial [Clostridia bacterium]